MKVIFLDRDGVINEYPGDYQYVTGWQDFHFLPRVRGALKKLNDSGCKVFIISNQAGVSKGIFSQQALDQITQNMLKAIEDSGAKIEAALYCIHHDEDNCSCRKPKTGLIDKARKTLLTNRPELKDNNDYFFIGDTMRDIQTGKSAGCKTILVFSGKEQPQNKGNWTVQPDYTAKDLSEAVDLILEVSGSY